MFYTLDQNNSGGYFEEDDDDGICELVVIEADSLEQFKDKAEELLSGYRNYCPCCGERWSDEWMDEDDGHEVPSLYGEPLDQKSLFRDRYFVHYLNGEIKEFKLK